MKTILIAMMLLSAGCSVQVEPKITGSKYTGHEYDALFHKFADTCYNACAGGMSREQMHQIMIDSGFTHTK